MVVVERDPVAELDTAPEATVEINGGSVQELVDKQSHKLTAEFIEGRIRDFESLYPEHSPIFYRHNKQVLLVLGISRQTLNDILTVAQEDNVIPVPVQTGHFHFYFREELVSALRHAVLLHQEGRSLEHVARLARTEGNRVKRLTIKGAAESLGILPNYFRSLIVEGKATLGNPVVEESIRRIMYVWHSERHLITPESLSFVRVYLLRNLTRGLFIDHHRHFYLTITEVARMAGCKINTQHAFQVAQILEARGIPVKALHTGNNFVHVLLREDGEKAVEVLKTVLEKKTFED